MKPLSEYQQQVVEFISCYLDRHGRSPTVREIQTGTQTKHLNSIARVLRVLERRWYIERTPGKARNITLIRED